MNDTSATQDVIETDREQQCEILDYIPANVCELPSFSVLSTTARYTFLIISCLKTLQWGVFNIPGTALMAEDRRSLEKFTQIKEYNYKAFDEYGNRQSCFYHFFLYRQKKWVVPAAKKNAKSFSYHFTLLKNFAKNYSLCGPVAGLEAIVDPDY